MDARIQFNAELAGYPSVFSPVGTMGDLGIPGRPGERFAVVPAGLHAMQLTPDSVVETNPTALTSWRR